MTGPRRTQAHRPERLPRYRYPLRVDTEPYEDRLDGRRVVTLALGSALLVVAFLGWALALLLLGSGGRP